MRDSASFAVSTPNFSNIATFFCAQKLPIASTALRKFGRPRCAASACHSDE